MKKIRYVLLGFGGIAENRIAKEGFGCDVKRIKLSKNAELVGAVDINSAREAAVEAMGLKWYENAEAVFADPSVDAVFIATNNRSHAPLAAAALRAGKHVLVEKPLAANSDEARQLVTLAESKHLSLSVDHMMVKNVLNKKAREMIRTGQLGMVNDACFHMEFAYGYDPAEAATWRCSDISELGGPIGDVASHCFYMAEFLFENRIQSVSAVYFPKLMPITVEDGAYLRFTLENGMMGSVRVSFCDFRGGLGGTLSGLGYEIYGDTAVLRSYGTMFQLSGYTDEPIRQRLELDKFSLQESFFIETPENIYQEIIADHAVSILNNQPMNGKDGLHNVLLCEAAHRSAIKSEPQFIESEPHR
jgi:predicted dehydrogenase